MCASPGSVHERTVFSSSARNRLEATTDIGATSQVRPVSPDSRTDGYAVNQELALSLTLFLDSVENVGQISAGYVRDVHPVDSMNLLHELIACFTAMKVPQT